MGILDSPNFRVITLNHDYSFSPTYSHFLVVPSSVPDSQLMKIKNFRSRGRIPVVCWYGDGAAIFRSSQPMVGLLSSRCYDDEDFFAKANIKYIIDARPKVNARANKFTGKGYEHSGFYKSCSVWFMNIHNVHKVRESYEALKHIKGDDEDFYLNLHNSRWLHHLKSILVAAKAVADILYYEKSNLLVHCSDGWDRTPQIVCIAQLLIDSFYRTFHGFQVLIEKEWMSFGHRFWERAHGSERSPIFTQFLDAVSQILRQFPTSFQFTDEYLLFIADSHLSGKYGNFLSDNEKQYLELKDRTISIWSEEKPEFFNKDYIHYNGLLNIKTVISNLSLWSFFTRLSVLT
jgi:myotubularin-related protein 1/2